MGIRLAQRVLAIGLVVFVVGAVSTPCVAASNRTVTAALLRSAVRSHELGSTVPGSPKPPKRSRYRIKSLRYATTLHMGDASVVVRFKAPLKSQSLVKFELLF